MNKRVFFIFCLLVLIFTLSIRWLVYKDLPQLNLVMPEIKEKKSVEKESVDSVKIVAVIERQKSRKQVDKKKKKINKKKKTKVATINVDKKKKIEKKAPHRKKVIDKRSGRATKNVDKLIKVSRNHMYEGLRLLKGVKPVPLLELDFEDIGVANYISIMRKMEGHVFVGSGESRTILGEAVIYSNGYRVKFIGFKEGDLDLEGLAIETPHELVETELAEEIISAAERAYKGEKDLRCVVILPVQYEAAFIGALNDAIQKAGFGLEDFTYFSGRYKNAAGGISLIIKNGLMKKGKKVVLNIKLDISNLIL